MFTKLFNSKVWAVLLLIVFQITNQEVM